MKNLLLPLIFTFLSFGSYLNAQGCLITEARISPDSNCLFVTWQSDLGEALQPPIILMGGTQYFKNGIVDGEVMYSRLSGDIPATCDTLDAAGFKGIISFKLFSDDLLECEFIDGVDVPSCPDDVMVSSSGDCLVFMADSTFSGSLPDSVRFKDTMYYNPGYDSNNPRYWIFSNDTNVVCDTTNMTPMPLSDTLYVGQRACTYEAGILPISILAFDYKNETNGVALSWAVNSEEPAQKLHLQRSYDGINWVSVYEQNLDNYLTGQTMDGKYMDQSIEQAKVYYRLFISGYAGAAKYSNILPVTMKDQVINNLFYQSQSRSIMIKAGQNYAGEMHLMNTHGQNVMTQKIRIQKNTMQEVNIQGHLTPGIYFVKFENSLIPPAKLFID
ncbi:hypothetical protein KUV50_00755 [Membranicola marinus]|uniref:Por secretion system C-terminal sorting domain-containing protein n=1 Tax=Membranihabitans marinus TaxID=1227546 RepID=A0A953HRM8_9BACT|nr:hypothetical protein [Membranihabitans marinus]MBY5956643.1 hypothetical protein [Membranihabitans marinus]